MFRGQQPGFARRPYGGLAISHFTREMWKLSTHPVCHSDHERSRGEKTCFWPERHTFHISCKMWQGSLSKPPDRDLLAILPAAADHSPASFACVSSTLLRVFVRRAQVTSSSLTHSRFLLTVFAPTVFHRKRRFGKFLLITRSVVSATMGFGF